MSTGPDAVVMAGTAVGGSSHPGVLAQVLLQLSWPRPVRGTAMLAGLAAAGLAAVGFAGAGMLAVRQRRSGALPGLTRSSPGQLVPEREIDCLAWYGVTVGGPVGARPTSTVPG